MIPLLAFAIVAIIGIAALSVDVGSWRYQQRLQQSAADAAATAGAIALLYPTTAGLPAPPEVKAAAQRASSDNGFADDNGIGVLTVAVNEPPSDNTPPNVLATPYAPSSAVEAIVTKQQPSFFRGIFGQKTQAVSARAVAVLQADKIPQCLTQLDPNNGIDLNAGNLVAVDCSVAANGYVNVARGIDATNFTYHGNAPNGGVRYNGSAIAPTYSSAPIVDPCFKIPGCRYLQNYPIPPLDKTAINASGQLILSAPAPPGYAVVTNCCSGARFLPGLYYIYGGISGPVSGVGVTLVNVDGSSTVSGGGSGLADVIAPSTFGPPDNAPTAGVAFYQPPSNANAITNNGSPATWEGLFYAPTAQFTSHGKPDTFSMLVIGGFAITGNKTATVNPALSSALGVTFSQLPTHVTLAE